MNLRSLKLILFSFSLLLANLLQAQKSSHDQLVTKIDVYLDQVHEKLDLAGLTVAVIMDGEVIYTGARGYRNLETQEPMKPEYLFHFASVSKPFVATAVMQLVEQGKMDLDEKVTTYLPYFRLDDERYTEITVRQMLNHTSGMPDVQDYEWDKPQKDEGAAERYVRSLSDQQMIYDPGEGWEYSNMAFDAMGDVIAKVSGMSFDDYVKEHILLPLGMEHSSFQYPHTPASLRTTPHVWNEGIQLSEHYPYNRRHAPSSTLNSSVVEMCNWALANMNRGELNGNRILQEESYDLLWTRSTAKDQPAVGLSWFLRKRKGAKSVYHSGGDTGYSSFLEIFPEKKMAVILASNYDNSSLGMITDGMLDLMFGKTPKPPKADIGTAFAEIALKEGFESAKEFYETAAQEQTDDYFFGEGQLNDVGYYLMYQKEKLELATQVFLLNTELYPKAANPYDSLAEAYLNAGKKELATQYYEKALSIDPELSSALKQLKELKGE